MSYTSIQTFLEDVFGLPLATGQIAKIIQKVSAALSPSHLELQGALPRQPVMNIDETGHPENGQRMWTWGFHVPGTRGFTWFHVDPSRSTEVLYEFLGETFSGIIGCDYYGVYRKFFYETGRGDAGLLGRNGLIWRTDSSSPPRRSTAMTRATVSVRRGWGQAMTNKGPRAQQGRSAFQFITSRPTRISSGMFHRLVGGDAAVGHP